MKRITTGAYIASAAENAPKRTGPAAPKRCRACDQSASMRVDVRAHLRGVMPLPGCAARMFIGMLRAHVAEARVHLGRDRAREGARLRIRRHTPRPDTTRSASRRSRASPTTGLLAAPEHAEPGARATTGSICCVPLLRMETQLHLLEQECRAASVNTHGRIDHDE